MTFWDVFLSALALCAVAVVFNLMDLKEREREVERKMGLKYPYTVEANQCCGGCRHAQG